LADIYHCGKHVAKNQQKKLHWIHNAVQNGYSPAYYALGLFYELGDGVEKDLSKALKYYTLGAETENSRSQHLLALFYLKHYQDFDKAKFWLEKASAKGNTRAQISLANFYQNHQPNPNLHFEWLSTAAERGNFLAQANLATCYSKGLKELPKDDKKAFEWNMRASQGGDPIIYVRIASAYRQGIGVNADEKLAFHYYSLGQEAPVGLVGYVIRH
jgi:TPR repeat protein